ncbi:MAG: D-alanine--D-alanine ligase [bacterium]|nr:D-alanine--D-alanine ligase [bacterium]MDT8365041.1 D-alanine--D-alanine ligase [bacterium]
MNSSRKGKSGNRPVGRVGVLMGGNSAEREVSLTTGKAILGALLEEGVDAVGIDTQGSWREEIALENVATAFIALHGRGGEDGTIQGALELMGIPYTGPGVMASALAMDKIMTKRVLRAMGIPTPEYTELGPGNYDAPLAMGLPVVVKPNREGSTIGISVVREEGELEAAIKIAASHDPDVLVEKFVAGEDLTVGVLNDRPMAIVQIVTESGFYDYETKYVTGAKEYRVPASIGEAATRTVQEAAQAAARALRCCGAVRVDFRGAGDRFEVIEVNTIPGMTPNSLLPKSAAGVGIGFAQLVMEMLQAAGEGSR